MWNQKWGEQRRKLFNMLVEHSYQKKRVKLSSGRESDFYIDCKQVTLMTEGAALIGFLGNKILSSGTPVEAVGGLTMGADPIAMAIALESLRAGPYVLQPFVVRKEAKDHGTGISVECGAKLSSHRPPCAIVEDVVTTGASTIHAIIRASQAGFKPVRVLALVDRQEDHGVQNIKLNGLGRVYTEVDSPEPIVEALFTRADFERGRLL